MSAEFCTHMYKCWTDEILCFSGCSGQNARKPPQSEHPTPHDKHRNGYLDDQAEDDVWLEVAQPLGYNEDGNVAVIHFLTHACTRHHFLAVTMYHAAL